VSSATQDWKSGYPLLEGNCAYLPSYILEPHFTPEFAEVGLLPSFGITRMTHSVNYAALTYYERANAEGRRKGSWDNNIFYQEGSLYRIPDVGSSRTLEGATKACVSHSGIWPAQYFRLCTPGVLCNKAHWKRIDTDTSSWKESGNYMGIIQGCRDPVGINSCYAAYHTSLNYDNVITLVMEGSLRLSIGIWNTSLTDVLSATQARKPGCPLLEGSHAYLPSHILEPYFTPEFAEVGLLPFIVITRLTHQANDNDSLAMDRRRQLLSKLPHLTQRVYG
jgi:hypothetical protein